MSAMRWIVPLFASVLTGSCGLYVPEIQENPFDKKEATDFVQEIVMNIRCEVQDAVVNLYATNSQIDPQNRNLSFFDSWAVQISLTLTIDEKGSLNPVIDWLPTGTPTTPSSIFGLNLGATLSSDASRTDKIGSFYLVSDLKKLEACPPQMRGRGPFILESDLKLGEWLTNIMIASGTEAAPLPSNTNNPLKSNVLSHEVKFDIVSSGFLTPSWKLRQSTINTTGNFLTGSRDRTQDLTITLGPADLTWVLNSNGNPIIDAKTKKPLVQHVLSTAAANTALASEIGNSVTNGVRNALQP